MKELNLLPPDRLKSLKRGKVWIRARSLVLVFFFSVLLMSVVGGVLVIWTYVTLAGEQEEDLMRGLTEYRAIKAEVDENNIKINQLNNEEESRLVSSILVERLLSVVPAEVTIEQMTVDVEDKEIVISGVAATRASLLVFQKQLEDLPWVSNVASPSNNLFSRTDSPYQFTLTVGSLKEV